MEADWGREDVLVDPSIITNRSKEKKCFETREHL